MRPTTRIVSANQEPSLDLLKKPRKKNTIIPKKESRNWYFSKLNNKHQKTERSWKSTGLVLLKHLCLSFPNIPPAMGGDEQSLTAALLGRYPQLAKKPGAHQTHQNPQKTFSLCQTNTCKNNPFQDLSPVALATENIQAYDQPQLWQAFTTAHMPKERLPGNRVGMQCKRPGDHLKASCC